MNSWWAKILLVSATVFVFAKWGPGIPITSVVTQKQDLFTVTGEGKVTVVPDTATTNIGITVSKNSLKLAKAEANVIINKITSELKRIGIKENDIKTQNYYIYPQYNTDRIEGYQVSISLFVRVRDLEKINQVLDIAIANNANNVGGINLMVDEDKQKELEKGARALAIKQAQEKAAELAKLSGMTLGKIVNIQEGYSNPRPPIYAKEMMTAGGGDTQIQPGSTDITTSVTLYYETR